MSVRAPLHSITLRRGHHIPARFVAHIPAALALLLMLAAALSHPFQVEARSVVSRLGGTAPEAPPPQAPYTEVAPIDLGVLPVYGPLASDGAGRLLMLVNEGSGYTVYGSSAFGFEPIYKRKNSYGVSLAIGYGGEFCVATSDGLDCVDGIGNTAHYRHEHLTHLLSVAFAPDASIWALRTTQGGGTHALQLVRLAPDSGDVQPILTLRQSVSGFYGNGLTARSDGSVLLPVVENDTARILQVWPDGTFTRLGDYFDLSGSIASLEGDATIVAGIKRPQSLQEQRNPQDVASVQPAHSSDATSATIVTRLPVTPGGTRLTSYMAVGGDGVLYLIRHQYVPMEAGPAQERPVLWAAELGNRGALHPEARVIDFRIPYIERIENPALTSLEYTGPLFIAPGQGLYIHGINFDGKDGMRSVRIADLPGHIDFWSDGLIMVNLPDGLPGGEAEVHVTIDHVRSESEHLVVKTPEVPGWFQIGSPSLRRLLTDNPSIVGYDGRIMITGELEDGTPFFLQESMASPGLYTKRLPNGEYTATFSAAYVESTVIYSGGFTYEGSSHRLAEVPMQEYTFRISDLEPVTVWLPSMLEVPKEG